MAPDPSAGATPWKTRHTSLLILFTVLIFLLCNWVSIAYRLYLWWAVMALLAGTAVVIGEGIAGDWKGILIDDRNKMSLSRLQLTMWTIVIVSAFIVFFFWRLGTPGDRDPLGFSIPIEIWGLLGISTASLAGSSLIKTTKKNQSSNVKEEDETTRKMKAQGQDPSNLRIIGRAVINDSLGQASPADLFRGEESGNASSVSVGKFQMFYFTIVAVVSYSYVLAHMFGGPTPGDGFPDVSPGLLGLLGISHAGYLADKAMPHTQDPAPDAPAAPAPPAAAPAAAPAPGAAAAPAPVVTASSGARRMGQTAS